MHKVSWLGCNLEVLPAKARSNYPKLKAFGAYLEELRGKKRTRAPIVRRLRELGTPLGDSTLSQYEKGAVWSPDATVLLSLSSIYGVSIGQMLELLRLNRKYPDAVDVSDLLRHDGEQTSSLPPLQGESDVPAETRIRELEGRVHELQTYKSIVEHIRPLLAELIAAVGSEGDEATGTETSRRRRHRKANR